MHPSAWLLCTEWVADVMSHTAEQSLGWRPALQVITEQTIDISIMLYFLFWDIVYCPGYCPVTGILHFLNQTPVDWFTKLQSTVEGATFGSEYVAARTCTDHIIDLRLTLHFLAFPLKDTP